MATLTEAVAGGTVVDARPIRSESLRPRSRVRVQDTEALPLSPATTAPPPYHDDLFDNPLRYEILTSAYTPGNIAAILAVLGGLQLVAHALEYGLHGAATDHDGRRRRLLRALSQDRSRPRDRGEGPAPQRKASAVREGDGSVSGLTVDAVVAAWRMRPQFARSRAMAAPPKLRDSSAISAYF